MSHSHRSTISAPFSVNHSPINHLGQVAHYDRQMDGVSQIAYLWGNSLEDRLFQTIPMKNLIPNNLMNVYMQVLSRDDGAAAVQLIIGKYTGVCFGTG